MHTCSFCRYWVGMDAVAHSLKGSGFDFPLMDLFFWQFSDKYYKRKNCQYLKLTMYRYNTNRFFFMKHPSVHATVSRAAFAEWDVGQVETVKENQIWW